MSANPRNPVGSAQSVESLLKSIRSKVTGGRPGVADGNKPEDSAAIANLLTGIRHQLDHSEASGGIITDSVGIRDLKPQDISRINAELQTALTAHSQVGQLNPRRSGIHNQALQAVKKTMRRSLTWYTRPLHLFQSAVIRALQQISSVLASHDNSLQQLDSKLDHSTSTHDQQIVDMRRELETLRSELQAVKNALPRNSSQRNEGKGDRQT